MNLNTRMVLTRAIFTCLATTILILTITGLVSAACPHEEKPAALGTTDIKKVQETLRAKGYYTGEIDGHLGPQTRAGIRQFQKSQNLEVTGRLDTETAGKLGVGPESIGGSFKGAEKEVGKGGEEAGHELKKGKPVAAGKEMGKGLGRGGKEVGKGVKEAVSPESDRGDREKKTEKRDNPQP